MDYAAVITDLESKRSAIDQVLDGFRLLAGAALVPAHRQLHAGGGNGAKPARPTHGPTKRRRVVAAPAAPAAPRAHPPAAPAKPAGPAPRGKFTPEKLVKAEMLYGKNVSCEEIGRQLGMSSAAVGYQAAQRGWKHKKVTVRDPGYQPGVPE